MPSAKLNTLSTRSWAETKEKRNINKMKKKFTVITLFLLAACTSKSDIAGTYFSETANRTITFKPDGKAFESSSTTKFEDFSYSVEGKTIKTPGRIYQFTLMDDGSINGGAGYGVLKKK